MMYNDDLVHKGQLAILAFLGPPWGINPMTYYTMRGLSTIELHLAELLFKTYANGKSRL